MWGTRTETQHCRHHIQFSTGWSVQRHRVCPLYHQSLRITSFSPDSWKTYKCMHLVILPPLNQSAAMPGKKELNVPSQLFRHSGESQFGLIFFWTLFGFQGSRVILFQEVMLLGFRILVRWSEIVLAS